MAAEDYLEDIKKKSPSHKENSFFTLRKNFSLHKKNGSFTLRKTLSCIEEELSFTSGNFPFHMEENSLLP